MTTEPNSICKSCNGEGWVCVEHPNQNWETCSLCPIKEGVPCAVCNLCDEHNPPRMQPGFKAIIDDKGFHPYIVGGKDEPTNQ